MVYASNNKISIAILILINIFIHAQYVNPYKLNVPKVLLPFHSSKLISFVLEVESEVSTANEDLCFIWSSSRPDIVQITPIYDTKAAKAKYKDDYGNINECSSKAIVSAVSKHPTRMNSVILAKETKTDKLIRCDVIVDKINSIKIKHTTTHLYLEDSPESFTAEALDAEGNTFSSLDGLPFEWSIINDPNDPSESGSDSSNDSNLAMTSVDSRNVLRISKFIDSEYVVSDSIRQLESIGLSGNKILIEGLKTGTANVQAKLLDSFYKDTLKTPLVRLLVVANILLEPSYPIYILEGAVVKYNVFLIKQTSIEAINLPSLQYFFESRNTTVANLMFPDIADSYIIGINVGSTEIVLIDRNMRQQQLLSSTDPQIVLPPPTAVIHVVNPDSLIFSIKNWRSSWILEVGRTYEIMVLVYTNQRQPVYPSDNLKIESMFDSAKFHLVHKSTNGSYHILTVLEKGLTKARAKLDGTIIPETNQVKRFKFKAQGEQEIELLDPIEVRPKLVIFALIPPNQLQQDGLSYHQSVSYEYQLSASGGSGSYYWQSKNTTVASVNTQGVVKSTATRIGQTSILVTDTRNTDIQAKSEVYVLEPVDLQLLACPVETQAGSKLYLSVKMNAVLSNTQDDSAQPNLVPITDCSRLNFKIAIKDEAVFRFVSVQSPSSISKLNPAVKDACAILVLDALRVGRSSIQITTLTTLTNSEEQEKPALLELMSNELLIGSYSQLKSTKAQITLSKDSSVVVNLFDGPLQSSSMSASSISPESVDTILSSNYHSRISISDESFIEVEPIELDYLPNRYSYRVKCKKNFAQAEVQEFQSVKLSISHRKSLANKCPVQFDYNIKVRCAQPHSLQLNQLFVNNDENINDLIFTSAASSLKWKCPIKLNSNLVMAHVKHPLLIQLIVRDSFNTVFDNFTTNNIEWHIGNIKYLERSHTAPNIRSIEIASAPDETGLILLTESDDSLKSNALFFQIFDIYSSALSKHSTTSLSAKLHLSKEPKSAEHISSNTLSIHFVSDVRIDPQALTIFNHPSNVVSLGLSGGSGHYQGEIETLKSQISNELHLNKLDSSTTVGNVLKINQITEHSIIVSPLTNNGLTLLHVYDYCVPPYVEALSKMIDYQEKQKRIKIVWPPAATAKIQVAGINSIVVNYEDEKVQINNKLRIYVQISDATGSLIKTEYFPLMGLTAKLLSADSSLHSVKGEISSSAKKSLESAEQIASIEAATLDELNSSNLNDEDKEYTAIYVLSAVRVGVVCIQFEAHSDGQFSDKGELAKTPQAHKLIRSGLKDIQVYSPLSVQPKYIELIRGAYFQIITTGGPNTPDASINYELLPMQKEESSKKQKKIIEINSDGIIQAVELGQIKVVAKSIGNACLPFTDRTISLSEMSAFRCNSENRVPRVYSEDFMVVKVVELRSINLQTPLKSIRQGNEMPIYVMGNEFSLNPLNFGSCSHLKFIWKINDQQIATLHHPLLFSSKNTQENSDGSEDLYSLFDNSFSLRFLARKPGTVRVSVRVEFKQGYNTNPNLYLSDTIDIVVFDKAHFTHLPLAYLKFINPQFSPKNKPQLELSQTSASRALLMSPGSQLQIKTNMDKLASKMSYDLAFPVDFAESKYCNNNTITVNKEGLITVKHINRHQLKHTHECLATVWVTVHLNENQNSKLQRLPYLIRVKPIVYSMLVVNKNSIVKISDSSFSRIRIDSKSLIRNRLVLNDAGIQMKWHVKYYDNLGEMFDVVSLSNEYLINRNDLVDLSQLNSNLFGLSYSSLYASDEQAVKGAGLGNNKQTAENVGVANQISLLANAVENSFLTRTIKPGRFIMELTPFATSFKFSRDYIGLFVEQFDATGKSETGRFDGIEANIGDIICLNQIDNDDDDDDDDYDGESAQSGGSEKPSWTSQTQSIVKLVGLSDSAFSYSHFGVCLNEGLDVLKKIKIGADPSSTVKLLKVRVKPIDKIKFINKSFKYITNSIINDVYEPHIDTTSSSKLVQFMAGTTSIADQNCTDNFELFFKSKHASSLLLNDLTPFRCSASLFTKSGTKLAYLDRIIHTSVVFSSQHWSCNVTFAPNSNYLLYELIDNNIDRPLVIDCAESLNKISSNNEPSLIRVYVESKFEDSLGDDSNPNKYLEMPFIPAFFVQAKQIELPIVKTYTGSAKPSCSDHFSLVIHATQQLHSHLILTTNCPTFIQIKPLNLKSTKPDVSSLLTITYDIITSADSFDINAYTALLQQQKGELYVQIACSLTQQVERIPIKFLFNLGEKSRDVSANFYRKSSSGMMRSLLSWFDFSQNEMLSFFVLVMVTLITVLLVLRIKTPSQQRAEQMALNVSAATAAAVAANAYRQSPGVVDTFNPYRYFSGSPEAPSSDYLRSRDTRASGRTLNMSGSTQNISSLFRSPPRQQMSRDDQTTPSTSTTIYHQTPSRMSPAERDGVTLFSPKEESQAFSPRNTFITYDNDDSSFFPRRNVPRSNQYNY